MIIKNLRRSEVLKIQLMIIIKWSIVFINFFLVNFDEY